MNKVGRNDPCPCGSGKKYKKCHGASNVVEMSPERYNSELERLHEGLITFAFSEYEDELVRIIQKFPQPSFLEDQERMDSYMSGLTAWLILHEPIKDDQTIFDIFYKRQQKKIKHESVRRTFAAWSRVTPSIYKVLSITEERAKLEDNRTKDMYHIAIPEESDLEEGDMVIGILLPFVQQHEFLLTMLEFSGVNEKVIDTASVLSDEEFTEDFPYILAHALAEGTNTFELEWDNPLYEMVAELFTRHMRAKAAGEAVITTGTRIWKLFTERTNPSFRKLGTFAAAIEYVIQDTLLPESVVQTQKELAEEYDTTANTVSKNVRKITETMSEDLEDIASRMNKEEVFPESVEDADIGKNITDNGPLSMEKMMRDIQKTMGEQDFDSEEEMHQFLDQLMANQDSISSESTSPRDIAQDKLYEAQASKGTKRKKLVKEALEIYPNSPDAYTLMAEDAQTLNEVYQLLHQAVIAGEKDLGEAFFQENTGHFWMMTETRPYMRAKAELAAVLDHLDDKSQAITHYEELLELNPHDNQGVRYQLLPVYLEEGEYKKAEELLHQYDGDIAASFLFNDVLLHYFRDGLTSETKNLLKKADKQNPYVKDYLTGKKAVPKHAYDYIGIGDETEAAAYAQENIHLWKEAKPLIEERFT